MSLSLSLSLFLFLNFLTHYSALSRRLHSLFAWIFSQSRWLELLPTCPYTICLQKRGLRTAKTCIRVCLVPHWCWSRPSWLSSPSWVDLWRYSYCIKLSRRSSLTWSSMTSAALAFRCWQWFFTPFPAAHSSSGEEAFISNVKTQASFCCCWLARVELIFSSCFSHKTFCTKLDVPSNVLFASRP